MKIFFLFLKNKNFILFAILLLATTSRLWLLFGTLEDGLTVDELQSTTHSYLPIHQLLESVRTFDPHPPFYYIQLHLWILVGNTSDLWLKLNPILWSILTVLSLYWIGKRIYSFEIGSFAALLYALSPYSIAEAQAVRMYSMMVFIGLWVFFFTYQFLIKNQSVTMGVGIFLSSLAFLYSQGAGFMILASSISYGLLLAWQNKINKTILIQWGIIQFMIILLYLPWLIQARAIHVEHTLAPSLTDIAYTFSQLLLGVKIPLISFYNDIYPVILIIFCLLIIFLILQKESRAMASSFILVPIIACLFFSYLIRPIWLTRTLTLMTPFLSLGIAIATIKTIQSTANSENSMKRLKLVVIVTACAGIFIAFSILADSYQQTHYPPWSNLLQPVLFVKNKAQESDIIYIPNERIYWGWGWYFIEPGSINPLTTDYDNVVEGVRIVSRASLPEIPQSVQTVWVIYRPYDGDDQDFLNQFADDEREIEGVFRDIIIERITLADS